MDSWGCFEIVAPKTLNNIQNKICTRSSLLIKSHYFNLQLTAGLKTPLQILFWKGKFVKFEKSQKIPLQNCPLFRTLQVCSPEFLTWIKTDSKKKCFLWLFLQLKIHQEEVCKSFKKVTVIWFLSRIYLFLKNRFHNHGMFRKLLFWKFRKIPRKTTWVEFLWRYSSFPVYQLYL